MLRFVFVEMNVDMRLAVMAMPMHVNVRALAQHPQHREDAKSDDHQRHAKFQPLGDRRRNGHPKYQDHNTNYHQRSGVPGAPQASDERGSKHAAMFANDRRDGHDMIDFGRVLETEHKSQAE